MLEAAVVALLAALVALELWAPAFPPLPASLFGVPELTEFCWSVDLFRARVARTGCANIFVWHSLVLDEVSEYEDDADKDSDEDEADDVVSEQEEEMSGDFDSTLLLAVIVMIGVLLPGVVLVLVDRASRCCLLLLLSLVVITLLLVCLG